MLVTVKVEPLVVRLNFEREQEDGGRAGDDVEAEELRKVENV